MESVLLYRIMAITHIDGAVKFGMEYVKKRKKGGISVFMWNHSHYAHRYNCQVWDGTCQKRKMVESVFLHGIVAITHIDPPLKFGMEHVKKEKW